MLLVKLARLEQGVQSHHEGIVHDFWDDSCQQGTGDLQAGVRVCLNEVYPEALVYHEVVAEQLEAVLDPMRIDAAIDRPEGVSHQPLNLREDVPHEVYGQRGVVRV